MTLINKQEIIRKLNESHYSDKTVSVYASWICRFIKYHNLDNNKLEIKHIQSYLKYLVNNRSLKPSTHNQALNSVVFFYQKILTIKINKSSVSALRTDHKQNALDILSKKQVENVAYHLKGQYQLLVYLLYGCGLRSSEVLNLKIKDINFVTNQLTVSNLKYYRTLSIPTKITNSLKSQIEFIKGIHHKDKKNKFFKSTSEHHCYLFPMKQFCNDKDNKLIRSPIISNTLNYNITTAAKKAGITFKVTAQTFRHSFAVRLLQDQIDIKTVQKLLGHKHASSTLIYSYVTQKISRRKSLSPLDLN